MQEVYEKFRSTASQVIFIVETKEEELKVFTTKALGISLVTFFVVDDIAKLKATIDAQAQAIAIFQKANVELEEQIKAKEEKEKAALLYQYYFL